MRTVRWQLKQAAVHQGGTSQDPTLQQPQKHSSALRKDKILR